MAEYTRKNIRGYFLILLSISILIGSLYLLLIYLSPEKVVNFFGIKNAYILIFVMAICGGFTTFNAIPYHPLLIALSAGGLNPFILGILAATGVSLGDSTSYLLGYGGRSLLSERSNHWFERIKTIAAGRPKIFILLCFLYSTFLPLSNDLITIPAGLAQVPFIQVMIPLYLGNLIFDTTLAILSPHFYTFFQSILHF